MHPFAPHSPHRARSRLDDPSAWGQGAFPGHGIMADGDSAPRHRCWMRHSPPPVRRAPHFAARPLGQEISQPTQRTTEAAAVLPQVRRTGTESSHQIPAPDASRRARLAARDIPRHLAFPPAGRCPTGHWGAGREAAGWTGPRYLVLDVVNVKRIAFGQRGWGGQRYFTVRPTFCQGKPAGKQGSQHRKPAHTLLPRKEPNTTCHRGKSTARTLTARTGGVVDSPAHLWLPPPPAQRHASSPASGRPPSPTSASHAPARAAAARSSGRQLLLDPTLAACPWRRSRIG